MLPRNVVLSVLIAVMPAIAWAGATDRVDTLLREYSSISRDLNKTQLAQSALIAQKAAIDDRGSDLSKRQDVLNAHPRDPNAAAPIQQAPVDENKSRCNGDRCDNKTKKLSKMSIAVTAGALPLETRQTRLDLEYNQYAEAAHDWNAREQQTITALNGLYSSMNNWADRAEGLVTSAPFQAVIHSEHWERYCPDRAMPSGRLSIDEVMSFADGYAGCLKYVAAHRAATAMPASS